MFLTSGTSSSSFILSLSKFELFRNITSLITSLFLSVSISTIILESMRISMPLQSLLDLPDRSSCTCSCFDNRFKQGNPSLGLYKAYKSFYFNSRSQSLFLQLIFYPICPSLEPMLLLGLDCCSCGSLMS